MSVVIPARNEEASIERTVRAMLAQTWESLEVIVVDDRSEDGTGAILARLAQGDSRLRVLTGSEPPPGWLGKPWALHQGSAIAAGGIFLFVDADVVYEPPAIAAAVAYLEETGAAMIALAPDVVMKTFWERVAMPQLAFALFAMIPTWLSNRTRIVRLAIGAGTGNLVRRDDYDAAGGHEALRDAVVDDVATARLLRRSGRRTLVVRAEDFVSVRMYEGGRAIIDGFTKNAFAVLDRSYVIALLVLVLGIVFHVLPYILAAGGELLSIVTVGIITLTRVVLFLSLRYPLHFAIWAHPLMILVWSWIWIRSAWMTGVRRRLAWRGRSYDAGGTRF